MTANSVGKPPDVILAKIHEIDRAKVTLEGDLAELYQVPTRTAQRTGEAEFRSIPT